MMEKNNLLALAALAFLMSGCANMDYRQQAALRGAAAGTIIGGGIGGGIGAATDGKNSFSIGGPRGATTGALIVGVFGLFFAQTTTTPPASPPSPRLHLLLHHGLSQSRLHRRHRHLRQHQRWKGRFFWMMFFSTLIKARLSLKAPRSWTGSLPS